jgi:preprotein translocase subunit SecG
MVFLKILFIIVEVLCCLMLIGLILLQKSKSEGLGMAFGAGVGESLFGARAGNVLSKATVILGVVFMANTLVLGIIFAQKDKSLIDQIPATTAQPMAMQGQPVDAADLVESIPATATVQPQAKATDVVPANSDMAEPKPRATVEPATVQPKTTGSGGAYIDPDVAEAEAGAAIATAKKAVAEANTAKANAADAAVRKSESKAQKAADKAIQAEVEAMSAITEAVEANSKANKAVQAAEKTP